VPCDRGEDYWGVARRRTGTANFPASGLKRQDNDLIVIVNAEAAAFKRAFDARFASGEALSAGRNMIVCCLLTGHSVALRGSG
jgi:hypothetical protein